jgi:hypothetical protein
LGFLVWKYIPSGNPVLPSRGKRPLESDWKLAVPIKCQRLFLLPANASFLSFNLHTEQPNQNKKKS